MPLAFLICCEVDPAGKLVCDTTQVLQKPPRVHLKRQCIRERGAGGKILPPLRRLYRRKIASFLTNASQCVSQITRTTRIASMSASTSDEGSRPTQCCIRAYYSITRSAGNRTDCGTVTPAAREPDIDYVTITSNFCRTRSAARVASRSVLPLPNRLSQLRDHLVIQILGMPCLREEKPALSKQAAKLDDERRRQR